MLGIIGKGGDANSCTCIRRNQLSYSREQVLGQYKCWGTGVQRKISCTCTKKVGLENVYFEGPFFSPIRRIIK